MKVQWQVNSWMKVQWQVKANVTLYGALASILEFAFAAQNTKATANGGLCRVLMVAGAGFEPAAFRL